jgi:hypothetical protein
MAAGRVAVDHFDLGHHGIGALDHDALGVDMRPGNCVTLPTPYAIAASTPRNVMPSTRSSTSSSNSSRQTSKSRSLNAWCTGGTDR